MRLDVDTDRLRESAAGLGRRATAITGELDRLDDEARALSGRWSGAAQAAFAARHAADDARLRARAHLLSQIAQESRRAAQEYEDADARGAERIRAR